MPFRLTHNMVEAMGHGALQGTFQAACLVSLKKLDILKSISIKSFTNVGEVVGRVLGEGRSGAVAQ